MTPPNDHPPAGRPRLARRMIFMLLIIGVLFGVVYGYHLVSAMMMKKFMAAGGEPPATVSTTRAAYQDWQDEIPAVGSLRALRGVDLGTEVAGLVRRVGFQSGQQVAAGTVLVELNGEVEQAQVEVAQAAVELARTTLERDRQQLAAQAVSRAQVDLDEADLKGKAAQLAQQQATLAKKSIRAPFAGQVGIATVNPGQYLNTGDKLVTLQTIDPILVDFGVPQRELARLARGQPVRLASDAFPARSFEGRITAINPLVDAATRNLQVEATVRNPRRELLPGMFAKVGVLLHAHQHVITLPQAAVAFNPYGATVFLAVTEAGKEGARPTARQVFVTTGATRGDQVEIVKGIKEGDVVVSSGQLKLKNGTPLIVDNHVLPAADAHPTPQEQ